ncbi:hypothetical protein K4H04_23440, partial [Mycobacterium tuberculosis]|nr:hypothetical protein [Mycobacterium tuberculosis]
QGDPGGVGGDDDEDGGSPGRGHRHQDGPGLGRVADRGAGARDRPAVEAHGRLERERAPGCGKGGGEDATVLDPLEERLLLVRGTEGDD